MTCWSMIRTRRAIGNILNEDAGGGDLQLNVFPASRIQHPPSFHWLSTPKPLPRKCLKKSTVPA
jgi:hypothetical protein